MDTTSDRLTRPVKVRGLLLNPPDGGGPRPVYVNDDDDWLTIYRHPNLHVVCLTTACPTRLIAKQMQKSGLRFFARMGEHECDHHLTELPLEPDDVEIDPVAPGAGGGPESAEHLWVKGRLFAIATKHLHQTAIVEESMTRADVYLPDSGIVLEYQRWATDFEKRSQQRRDAGATRTIWLLPTEESHRPSFQMAVRHEGAMYLAVLSMEDYKRTLRPWEHPEDNRLAGLYVSGSVVRFNSDDGRLERRGHSLYGVLDEIISGKRILTEVPVYTKKTKTTTRERVWVLTEDLARLRAARASQLPQLPCEVPTEPEPDHVPLDPDTASPTPSAATPSGPEPPSQPDPAAEAQATAPVSVSPTPPVPAPSEPSTPVLQDLTAHTRLAVPLPAHARPTEPATPPPPAEITASEPTRSLWSRITAWFRRQ